MNKLFTNAALCGLFAVTAIALTGCGDKCKDGVCTETKEVAAQEQVAATPAPEATTVATAEATAEVEAAPATTEVAA